MATRPSKPKSPPDPPLIHQLSEEEAPHLYEDGVYYPGAAIPGLEPEVPPVTQPSLEEAPHLYEDGVFYPATDGAPLPDGETQGFAFQTLVTTLRAHYADQPRTRVNGNTFIYYDQNSPGRAVSPDCYVAFDVDVDVIDYHDNYRIWAVGKPPDFVLEIASQSTAVNDLRPKRELYIYIGIGEYWRYDPTPDSEFYGEKLVGERQVNGQWERIPVEIDVEGSPRGYSPTLGLDLVWTEDILRFYDPATGEWVKTHEEEQAARAVAESMLAGEQAARAAAEAMLAGERSARAAAEARAAELETELRRLRGEAT